MTYLRVDLAKLEDYKNELAKTAHELNNIHDEYNTLARHLDWDISSHEGIDQAMNRCRHQLTAQGNILRYYSAFLVFINPTIRTYRNDLLE